MNPFEGYRNTSPYGIRRDPFNGQPAFHTGIDLVIADRAPIKAFTSGVVVHAKMGETGSGFGGFGNVVALKDASGAIQFYAHLSNIFVKVGQQIAKGQVVGTQGNTGHSTGSHLHYEVRTNGNASGYGFGSHTEPTAYLQKFIKGEPEMSKDDANKIIDQLKVLWGAAKDQKSKDEIHRLANVCRTTSGQPTQ